MQNCNNRSKIGGWLITVMVVIFLPIQGLGQTAPFPQTPYSTQWVNFEHLTGIQGLLNERVQAIVQDKQGFLWFGTWNGLFRYDGYTLKNYQHDAQIPGSLPENGVFSLYVDRHGTLWVGTQTKGLWRFDYTANQFRPASGNPAPAIKTIIRAIMEDRQGVLWIGTDGQGVYRLDPGSGAWRNDRHNPEGRHSLSNNYIHAIFEDHAGNLWVGARNGLNKFAPQSGLWTPYMQFANAIATSPLTILSIVEDRQGMLWLAAYGAGLYRFDPQTAHITRFTHDPADPNSLSDNKVSSLYYDRHGELWAGTWSEGLNRFIPETGGFIRYRHEPMNPSSLGHGAVMTMYEDRAGSLWIGVDGWGISVYHRARTPFRHYTDNPLAPDHLSDRAVRPIYQTRDGIIWIGTAAGGLNRLNPKTGHITCYRHDPDDPYSLSDNSVYALFEDHAGALWVGTYHGLNRFDRATQQFTRFLHDPNDSSSLSYNFIRAIAEEADGHLWIGTHHGLNQFDPISGRFQRYLHDPERPDSLSDESVLAIMFDREHSLWVGTLSGGLNRFEPRTEGWVHYRHHPDEPASLSHDTVYALYEDRAGQIWIGTLHGLDRLDRATGQVTRDTLQDGLPSETITGILEEIGPDDAGGGPLWLSTLNGLIRFDPRTAAITVFDRSDGLLNQEYDLCAAYRTLQGELWFGGKKGIDVVDPSQIVKNTFIPPVVLTDFEISNQPVPIGGTSLLQQTITMTDALMLSYREHVITFEFAALNFIAPTKNRYQYRLEGFDADWIAATSDRRRVTYTNLDAGRYLFRVRGSNNDGIWNDTGVSLALTITPPWWRTWWFYALCTLGVLGVFGLVYRNKTTQLRKERALSTALKESEGRYRAFFEQGADGVVILNPETGEILEFNDLVCRQLGYTREEFRRLHVADLEVQESVEDVQARMQRVMTTGYDDFETQQRTKNGEIKHVHVTVQIIETGKNSICHCIWRDITNHKRAEEALRKSELQLSNAMNMARLGHWELDVASGIFTFSENFYAIFRTTAHEIGSYTMSIDDYANHFVHPEDRYLVAEESRKAIETDDPNFSRYLEHRMLYTDGGVGYIAVRFFIMKDDTGKTVKVYGVNQDITDRKQAEEAILALNAELEQRVKQRTAQLSAMNEELESFAYIVSHDLKAPLRNVSQLTAWLVQDYATVFDDTGKEYADLLLQRVKRMDNLIDGVLEYSRVGRMNTKTELIDLNSLLPEVVDTLAPPPHITITLPDALPTVIGDRIRFSQVFQNLLGNAIKFLEKPRGEINISYEDVGTMWQFRITDNGPGIAPQHHDTIFQIFRTNQSRDEVESTGVGLTIVKKIIEFYGGTIAVESEVGQGSTFVFTLPKALTVTASENASKSA